MPEDNSQNDERFDTLLRELGSVDTPEGAADRFWSQLRPKLEEECKRPPRWVIQPRWIFASAAAVAVIVLALAMWPGLFRGRLPKAEGRNTAQVFVPGEYDPALDFIVFRNGNVLAYQPATIDGDLRVFLQALDVFPARLQWLAVSGEQIQIGLNSGTPQTEMPFMTDGGAGQANEMLYIQIHVFRSGPGPSRPFAARVLTLPESQVHLDSQAADGAAVRMSLTVREPKQGTCRARMVLIYGSDSPTRIQKEMNLTLDKPACIGTFVAGKALCFVYVTMRRIPFVTQSFAAGA